MDTVPSAQSPSSPLFDLAREIDARLRGRATARRRNYALDALDLAECKRLELFRLLGYSSVTAYARAVNGFGASKTSDLIRIAEATDALPRIRKAFLAGQLHWCAAREIVKKATPKDEAEWLEKARRLTVAELRACVHEKAPTYHRPYEFDQQELGWVEDVVAGIRREIGPVSPGKALAEACRRQLAGEAGSLGGPGYRIVIYQCATCGKAVRQTSEGPVPVSAEDLELIECDAEVLDVRNGPAKVTRTAPPRIHNFVLGRDKGRCVVPGCRNRGVHFHHEDGWRNGHHTDRCFCLCDSHHRSRHRGFLRVEGSMPDLHFYLADGTYLGRAGDEERTTDPSSPEAEPTPRSAPARGELSPKATPPGEATADAPGRVKTSEEAPVAAPGIPSASTDTPSPIDDAVKALRKLGIDARAAERAVRGFLQLHPGRSWEAGDLVRAALATPPPPARAS
jgi:hypothetical protein